jgi:hypothetical protein
MSIRDHGVMNGSECLFLVRGSAKGPGVEYYAAVGTSGENLELRAWVIQALRPQLNGSGF